MAGKRMKALAAQAPGRREGKGRVTEPVGADDARVVSGPALEITPRQAVEQLEAAFGLSGGDLAVALGVDPRTIGRWHTGQCYPQHEARRRLASLLELQHHLRDTFTSPEAVRRWMHAANRYLGGLSPAEVVRVGRFDRVEAALESLDSGVYL